MKKLRKWSRELAFWLQQRRLDPDGDREGSWIESQPQSAGDRVTYLWLPDVLFPHERCDSELCLFGREWIGCKKRRGHKGIHRHSEMWCWEEARIDVNGVWLTRSEWKEYIEDCPHEHWNHPGVHLMDGTEMSICQRCLYIQATPIAKMIEQEAI